MAKNKKLSTKRFGARYGRTVKEKFAAVEKLQKANYKCPYCGYKSVKRMQVGIWKCTKCDKKMAGKAFILK